MTQTIDFNITKIANEIYEPSSENEEDQCSSESEQSDNESVTPTLMTKKKKVFPIWKQGHLLKDNVEIVKNANFTLEEHISDLGSELGFSFHLFPKELLCDIAFYTSLYSVQTRPEKPLKCTASDIEKFIASTLFMSIIKLPATRDYWSSSLEIKRFLHFSNNNEATCGDKLHKVRPLITKLVERLKNIPIEENLAVDEQIIPFKGRSSLKQYNPKKPHKWGYKVFVLSGVSGFSYNFELFTGKSDNVCVENEPDIGASGNVVIRLARTIPCNCNYKLYVDNWFNSIPLQIYLHSQCVLMVGTVRQNRLKKFPLPPKKELKKKKRGYYFEQLTVIEGVTLSVVFWFDNKMVTLLSNFVGSQPTTEVKRFSKSERKKILVTCPNVVQIYNKHMGDVDLLDSLLGYYRNKIRSKKWYHRIFFHLIDMTIVNAWILWNKKSAKVPLVKFKLIVADLLSSKAKDWIKKRGRPSEIKSSGPAKRGPRHHMTYICVQTDAVGHWPIPENQSGIESVYQLSNEEAYNNNNIGEEERVGKIGNEKECNGTIKVVFENCNSSEKFCCLLFDEIYIKPSVSFRGGHLIGYGEDNPTKIAKTLLVFMIKSIFGKPSFVCRIAPIFKLSVDFLHDLIINIIKQIIDAGGELLCLLSDNHPTSRSVYQSFVANKSLP
ncbi:piggyBac transposable element-derived protein 3-like [Hydra vulgaris]|uniref:PiggyBac transposable element-derived protein 3-like n=1 Tax=Hydra vulgaris TaxID=6087 RepID=A0ABM4B9B2_HYDVU